ncbi:putative toxin-antitoxin system toxin component, PIN family [Candidatus Woesearchaeota archaeon]|nr:putative toxin-antitoxin system toxin component, PIN family [Candidatus Woesearchaeota archaeon]
MKETSNIVKIKTSVHLCKDPKDNMFIELAIDGKADYIISNDEDLLSLDKVNNIKIISPSGFLGLIEK